MNCISVINKTKAELANRSQGLDAEMTNPKQKKIEKKKMK